MFQSIHNTTEDLVFAQVAEICDSIEKDGTIKNGAGGKFCTCPQCRCDTACYVLNRTAPRYVVSNRGVARVEQGSIERQQITADITSLVWEGLRRVQHNLRPTDHSQDGLDSTEGMGPVFNFPTIVGRLFNGANFEPLSGITVELRRDGELVKVRDRNWQNPCILVPNTGGTFTFWPYPLSAEAEGRQETFEFCIRAETPGFESLNHFFTVSVTSESRAVKSYSMNRSQRLRDLYMFPPGQEGDVYIDSPD